MKSQIQDVFGNLTQALSGAGGKMHAITVPFSRSMKVGFEQGVNMGVEKLLNRAGNSVSFSAEIDLSIR